MTDVRATRGLQHARNLAIKSVRHNGVVLILIGIHIAAAILLSAIYGFHIDLSPSGQISSYASAYFLFFSALYLFRLLKDRPEKPTSHLLDWMSEKRIVERVAMAAPILIALSFFMASFGTLKSAIPDIAPYQLDPILADIDRTIHGTDPWRLLHPLTGHPLVSYILNVIYHFWMVAFYMALIVFAATLNSPVLRKQFFIAFVLCWALLGNLAAILLSTVGPCFYFDFYGDPRFNPLMEYLHSANQVHRLAALEVQATLLSWSKADMPGLGRGISAMPSMHVSIACLLALLAAQFSWRWGLVGFLFLATIMIGSVHLGYHYAIDGYVSLLATPVIWRASRWLAVQSFKLAPSAP